MQIKRIRDWEVYTSLEISLRVCLFVVGTRMPPWREKGCSEYSKRMPPELSVKTIEVPLGSRTKSRSPNKAVEIEGETILKLVGRKDFVIALDVKGKSMCTAKLADRISEWQMQGKNISFMIGGPDGLSDSCLSRADLRWSISDLTLPHPLVRVLLLEQIYRAWTINNNHPYHRK